MNGRQTQAQELNVASTIPLAGTSVSFGKAVAADKRVIKKPLVFISYSHKDEVWKDRLYPHLSALEQIGKITLWNDRDIKGGKVWEDDIRQAMEQAQAAVCLISADFLASGFCMQEEMPRLLERRSKGELEILPVLVRPCNWSDYPWLAELQMLPRDGKAVATDYRDDYDTIFEQVAKQIKGRVRFPPKTLWGKLLYRLKTNKALVATGLLVTAILMGVLIKIWVLDEPLPPEILDLTEIAEAHAMYDRKCKPLGGSARDAYLQILELLPEYSPAKSALVQLDCDEK